MSIAAVLPPTPIPITYHESGQGEWVGIRFPPKRPPLTASQLEAEKVARTKAIKKQIREREKWAKQATLKKNLMRSNGGLCGLYNLGNTCYINSALQCLSFSLPLTEYFRSNLFLRELNEKNPLGSKGNLAIAYGKLIKQLWRMKEMEAIEPKQMKLTIGKYRPQFSGNQQHDAQEFLSFLLDGLHEDMNRVKSKPYIQQPDSNGRPDQVVAREHWTNYRARDDSVIVDLYTGLLKSSLKFKKCGRVSVTFDPYTSLSLPLPKEKVKHVEVTLIWNEVNGVWKRPTKYCIEFDPDQPPPVAAAPSSTIVTTTTTTSSSDQSNASSSTTTTSEPSTTPTIPSRPNFASSTRILDVKQALSRLSGLPTSRIQFARLQLSSFDIWKRTQFSVMSNYQSLSEFSLALQSSSGKGGNKLDCYYAFEVPIRVEPKPVTVPETTIAAAAATTEPSTVSIPIEPTPTGLSTVVDPVIPAASTESLASTNASSSSSTIDTTATIPASITPLPSAVSDPTPFTSSVQHDGVATSFPSASTRSRSSSTASSSSATSTSNVPQFHSRPVSPPTSSSISTHPHAHLHFPTSYGGVNGSVRLGMKFDVRDSVHKWEVATVRDIRMLVPVQVMKDCGGCITTDGTLGVGMLKSQHHHAQSTTTAPFMERTNEEDEDEPDEDEPEEIDEEPQAHGDHEITEKENSTAIQPVRFNQADGDDSDDEDGRDDDGGDKTPTEVHIRPESAENVHLDLERTPTRKKSDDGGVSRSKKDLSSKGSSKRLERNTVLKLIDSNLPNSENEEQVHFQSESDSDDEHALRSDDIQLKVTSTKFHSDDLNEDDPNDSLVDAEKQCSPSVEISKSNATNTTTVTAATTNTNTHQMMDGCSVNAASVTTRPSVTSSISSPVLSTPRFSPSPSAYYVYQHLTEIPRKLPLDHPIVELYFSFDGFSPRWDEWVALASPKIAPYGSGLTKTHGRGSGSGPTNNAPINSTLYLPNSYLPYSPYVPYYPSATVYTPPSEVEIDPGWIRVHCVQRCLAPVPNLVKTLDESQTASLNLPATSLSPPVATTGSSTSPVAPAASPASPTSPVNDPAKPFDMQFFSTPMLLWFDPLTTTHQQLYEMIWSRVKHFTKLPDVLTPEKEPSNLNAKLEQSIPEQVNKEQLVDEVDGISAQLSTVDATSIPLTTTESASTASSNTIAVSSSSMNITSVAPIVSDKSASASTLPSYFDDPATAPFMLRYTNHSGTQCSKCQTWNRICLGCALELNNPVVNDPAEVIPADATATSSPIVKSTLSRDSFLSAPSLSTTTNNRRNQNRQDWTNDCTICIDWNVDYFTCGLIDLQAQQELELDQSMVDYRHRQEIAPENRVDLNVCMSNFTSTEKLAGDAAVYCSSCKTHEEATKTLELYSTPPILVLHLKRLLPDVKLYTEVQFPLEGFDPKPFLSGHHINPVSRKPTMVVEEEEKGADTTNQLDSLQITVEEVKKDDSLETEPNEAAKPPTDQVESTKTEPETKPQDVSLTPPHDSTLEADVAEKVKLLDSMVSSGELAQAVPETTRHENATAEIAASSSRPTAVDEPLPISSQEKGDIQLTTLQPPSSPPTPTIESESKASSGAPSATSDPTPPTTTPLTSVPTPTPSPAPVFTPVPGGFDASIPASDEPDPYDLYAVVNHFGAIGGGHYITYCLSRSTQQWYRFDDSRVTPIPASSVVSNSAYMLFYERRGLSARAGVDACPAEIRERKLDAQGERILREADGAMDTCCTIQ